jgi:hypothetical protein
MIRFSVEAISISSPAYVEDKLTKEFQLFEFKLEG